MSPFLLTSALLFKYQLILPLTKVLSITIFLFLQLIIKTFPFTSFLLGIYRIMKNRGLINCIILGDGSVNVLWIIVANSPRDVSFTFSLPSEWSSILVIYHINFSSISSGSFAPSFVIMFFCFFLNRFELLGILIIFVIGFVANHRGLDGLIINLFAILSTGWLETAICAFFHTVIF